jgi:hypothetical protein
MASNQPNGWWFHRTRDWPVVHLERVMNFSSCRQSQKPWTGARNRPEIGRPRPVFEMHEMPEVHNRL